MRIRNYVKLFGLLASIFLTLNTSALFYVIAVEKSVVQADINGDGEFSIADIVIF